jgi:hypothetical protein
MSSTYNPFDGLTINESTQAFEEAGYLTQFAPRDGALVRCFACHSDSHAEDVVLDMIKRTEGASDPDDMVAIGAVRCPLCSARGTLILKYGPDSDLEDEQVLKALSGRR